MNRLALVLLAACSTKSSPPPASSGSASSGAAPPVAPAQSVWTGADGDVLVRFHDGKLDGACGPLGTATDVAFTYPGGSVSLAGMTANGGTYTLPGMTFHVEVAPDGAVTTVYADGTRVPSGKIAGAPAEATVKAMLAARTLTSAPTLHLAVAGTTMFRYDDGRVVDASGGQVLYDDKPAFDDPFWVASDAKVVRSGEHFEVELTATKDSYRSKHYTVTEKPLGTLAFGDKAFAVIPDRVACKAEDRQVASLLRAFLLSADGFHYLREHDLPEPLPPPPPPPRPK